jgi:glycosyltransferase involved in cell wall biosynthesis
MPLLSIIVPCYNSARFIAETVASVRAQTLADWELILLDDGSSDPTGEIITALAATDTRIKAVLKPNEGTCRTRNRGFAVSDPASAYLFFLDHDDLIEPRFAEIMCGHLAAHPEAGLVACQFEDLAEDGTRLGTGGVTRWSPGFFLPHTMREDEIETPFATFFSCMARGPFAVYRRSVYAQTEGWEVHFWPDEDSDMFCQMALLATVRFLPDRLYLKRTHAGQGSQDQPKLRDSKVAFRKKWDTRLPRNEQEAATLRQAHYFFYRRVIPRIYLMGAARAAKAFLKTGNIRELRRGLGFNLSVALRGLFSSVPSEHW